MFGTVGLTTFWQGFLDRSGTGLRVLPCMRGMRVQHALVWTCDITFLCVAWFAFGTLQMLTTTLFVSGSACTPPLSFV